MVDIHVKKRLLNQGRYLHVTNELAATAEVFKEFAQQQMEGCSSIVFSEDLQHFECFVAMASSGQFQTLS